MVQDQEGDFGVVMAFRSFFKMVWPDFHGNFLEMVLMRVFSPLLHYSVAWLVLWSGRRCLYLYLLVLNCLKRRRESR